MIVPARGMMEGVTIVVTRRALSAAPVSRGPPGAQFPPAVLPLAVIRYAFHGVSESVDERIHIVSPAAMGDCIDAYDAASGVAGAKTIDPAAVSHRTALAMVARNSSAVSSAMRMSPPTAEIPRRSIGRIDSASRICSAR